MTGPMDIRDIQQAEHEDSLAAKRVVQINSLVPKAYDYVGCTYNLDNNITQALFKTGGASGTVVATLTMTYDISGNLLTVTKT